MAKAGLACGARRARAHRAEGVGTAGANSPTDKWLLEVGRNAPHYMGNSS
jgi:hypothetical protein